MWTNLFQWPHHTACRTLVGACKLFVWHAGSSSLTRDGNPAPLHWELRVLATGPPGES